MSIDEKKTEKPTDTDDVAGHARAVEDIEEPPVDPPEEPPIVVEPPPPQVAELAAACVRFVASRYGVMLDFSPDTLSLVDQYVADARTEIAAKPQALEVVQAAAGAYLGEVMRRAFGGMWFSDGDHDGWRLDMERVYLTFNPIGMAREAIMLEAAEGWHAHLEMDDAEKPEVERRLSALPEVADTEFYAPTSRFEVVEIAIDALRAQMIDAGHGDVTFDAEDYQRR